MALLAGCAKPDASVVVDDSEVRDGSESSGASDAPIAPDLTPAFEPDPSKPDRSARHKIETSVQSIEVVAVARFVGETIECWKVNGERDDAIAARLSKAMSTVQKTEFAKSGDSTRWAVLQVKDKPKIFSFPIEARGFGMEPALNESGRGESHLRMMSLQLPKSGTEASLSLDVMIPAEKDALFDLSKPGETVTIDGVDITLNQPSTPRTMREGEPKRWYLAFDCEETRSNRSFMYVDLLGSDGKLLGFADAMGNPLTDEEAAAMKKERDPKWGVSKVRVAMPNGIIGFAHPSAISNIDPSKVGKARVRLIRRYVLAITGLPTEPR